jgi:hypothetical protein
MADSNAVSLPPQQAPVQVDSPDVIPQIHVHAIDPPVIFVVFVTATVAVLAPLLYKQSDLVFAFLRKAFRIMWCMPWLIYLTFGILWWCFSKLDKSGAIDSSAQVRVAFDSKSELYYDVSVISIIQLLRPIAFAALATIAVFGIVRSVVVSWFSRSQVTARRPRRSGRPQSSTRHNINPQFTHQNCPACQQLSEQPILLRVMQRHADHHVEDENEKEIKEAEVKRKAHDEYVKNCMCTRFICRDPPVAYLWFLTTR